MNKTKKSICIIIEMLLVLSIMLGVLSIFFRVVLLKESTYTNIFQKSNAYEQITQALYKKIDAALSAKNINYDIKESIITKDDIKKEADGAIPGFIDYLKTGENKITPVNTEMYKERVASVIHSTLNGIIKPTSNEITFNNGKNTSSSMDKYTVNTLSIVKNKSKVGQDSFKVEKLMSKEEAEAKVRDLLKQHGYTEEQAIQKAKEKGLTEDQALKILAGYGITIDDDSNKSKSDNSDSKDGQNQVSDSDSDSSSKEKATSAADNNNNLKKDNRNNSEAASKDGNVADTVKSPLDMIENKLIDEANSSIEKEVEKVDLSKMLNADKYQKLAKISSIIYKMFWLIMVLPIIFMGILIGIHKKNALFGLRQIGKAILTAGLILSVMFAGIYLFKGYEIINIGPVYFKEIISYAIKDFTEVLFMYGIITFVIGLLMLILMNIKLKAKLNQI